MSDGTRNDFSAPAMDPIELLKLPKSKSQVGWVGLVVLGAVIWRLGTFSPPQPVGYDESVYRAYAQWIGEHGVGAVRTVARIWSRDEVLSKASLPFRLGYLLPSVAACKLGGSYTVTRLAAVSLLFGVATCVVAFLLARRWAGTEAGFATALLVIVSPLGTLLSRRALPETCFAFAVALALLFFDRYWREGRPADAWLLGASLWLGFLTKETMVFLYPAFVLLALCYGRDGWKGKIPVVIPFVVAPLIHLGMVVWLSGGLQAAAELYRHYHTMQSKIPYALKYQTGPWFRYLVDLLLVSPMTTLLAFYGMMTASRATRSVLVFTLTALAFMSVITILNVRFILFLDPCLRWFAIWGVAQICSRFSVRIAFRRMATWLLLVAVVVGDVWQFYRVFDAGGIYDPVTAELLRANGFGR